MFVVTNKKRRLTTVSPLIFNKLLVFIVGKHTYSKVVDKDF